MNRTCDPRGRVLAIDYGEKRVGLALSDPLRIFAKPYLVVPNTGFKPLVARLIGIIESQQVGLVVLGMPYAIEGETPSRPRKPKPSSSSWKSGLMCLLLLGMNATPPRTPSPN